MKTNAHLGLTAGTYIVDGDAGHLDGWTVETLAAALRPVLSPLGVDVVERPHDFGFGGLIAPRLSDREALALSERVQRTVEHVVSFGAYPPPDPSRSAPPPGAQDEPDRLRKNEEIMKTVTITTETGTVQYQLVNGSALPAIKAGHLTFETRSGVQSIPAGAVLDFTIEAGRAGSKSDRIKDQLTGALDHLSALATTVHDEANNSTIAEDAAFAGALLAYAEAFKAFDVQKEKAERFFERRAKTLAKREAEGKTSKARKPVAAPAPSPTAFASDEPIANAAAPVLPPETAATPKPSSKKSAKK